VLVGPAEEALVFGCGPALAAAAIAAATFALALFSGPPLLKDANVGGVPPLSCTGRIGPAAAAAATAAAVAPDGGGIIEVKLAVITGGPTFGCCTAAYTAAAAAWAAAELSLFDVVVIMLRGAGTVTTFGNKDELSVFR
jgi:hypothetical protein